jgi:hypothetical protein
MDEGIRNEFKVAAVRAGTPEFLVINVIPPQAEAASPAAGWHRKAAYYENQWAEGQNLLV